MADENTRSLDTWLHTVHQLAPLIREYADEAEQQRRLSPLVVRALAEAVASMRSARAWLHDSIQQLWESVHAYEEVTFEQRAHILLAAANATQSAAAAVDMLYTAAGAAANYRRSPLQRALRDIHAATQHVGTAPQQFESAGRMLVGLPPLQPLIPF